MYTIVKIRKFIIIKICMLLNMLNNLRFLVKRINEY